MKARPFNLKSRAFILEVFLTYLLSGALLYKKARGEDFPAPSLRWPSSASLKSKAYGPTNEQSLFERVMVVPKRCWYSPEVMNAQTIAR